MNKPLRNILAVGIAILPFNIIMIWYRLHQTESFTTLDMLIYPLVFGGGSIILILLLNKFFLRETFHGTFNSGRGTWYNDILTGFGLAAVYFAMFFIERATLMPWLPRSAPPNREILQVLTDLAGEPLLMLAWFGPVLWIGIALFEELSRTFLLQCLWRINKNRSWHLLVIFLASALIGLVHLYQGVYGIITIGLKSLVAGFYFYRYRRILPLIIAHGLYDGLQLAYFINQIQN